MTGRFVFAARTAATTAAAVLVGVLFGSSPTR